VHKARSALRASLRDYQPESGQPERHASMTTPMVPPPCWPRLRPGSASASRRPTAVSLTRRPPRDTRRA
jgi:hypothetical protein